MQKAGIVVVAIIILAGAYLLFFNQSNEFSTGYSSIKAIWAEKGIDIEAIDFDESPQITDLLPYEIEEIKMSLEAVKTKYSGSTPERKALQLMVQVQVNDLEFVQSISKINSDYYSLEQNPGDYLTFCNLNLPQYNSFVSDSQALLQGIGENNDLIEDFDLQYSKDFGVSVANFSFETTEMETAVNELVRRSAELNAECD